MQGFAVSLEHAGVYRVGGSVWGLVERPDAETAIFASHAGTLQIRPYERALSSTVDRGTSPPASSDWATRVRALQQKALKSRGFENPRADMVEHAAVEVTVRDMAPKTIIHCPGMEVVIAQPPNATLDALTIYAKSVVLPESLAATTLFIHCSENVYAGHLTCNHMHLEATTVQNGQGTVMTWNVSHAHIKAGRAELIVHWTGESARMEGDHLLQLSGLINVARVSMETWLLVRAALAIHAQYVSAYVLMDAAAGSVVCATTQVWSRALAVGVDAKFGYALHKPTWEGIQSALSMYVENLACASTWFMLGNLVYALYRQGSALLAALDQLSWREETVERIFGAHLSPGPCCVWSSSSGWDVAELLTVTPCRVRLFNNEEVEMDASFIVTGRRPADKEREVEASYVQTRSHPRTPYVRKPRVGSVVRRMQWRWSCLRWVPADVRVVAVTEDTMTLENGEVESVRPQWNGELGGSVALNEAVYVPSVRAKRLSSVAAMLARTVSVGMTVAHIADAAKKLMDNSCCDLTAVPQRLRTTLGRELRQLSHAWSSVREDSLCSFAQNMVSANVHVERALFKYGDYVSVSMMHLLRSYHNASTAVVVADSTMLQADMVKGVVIARELLGHALVKGYVRAEVSAVRVEGEGDIQTAFTGWLVGVEDPVMRRIGTMLAAYARYFDLSQFVGVKDGPIFWLHCSSIVQRFVDVYGVLDDLLQTAWCDRSSATETGVEGSVEGEDTQTARDAPLENKPLRIHTLVQTGEDRASWENVQVRLLVLNAVSSSLIHAAVGLTKMGGGDHSVSDSSVSLMTDTASHLELRASKVSVEASAKVFTLHSLEDGSEVNVTAEVTHLLASFRGRLVLTTQTLATNHVLDSPVYEYLYLHLTGALELGVDPTGQVDALLAHPLLQAEVRNIVLDVLKDQQILKTPLLNDTALITPSNELEVHASALSADGGLAACAAGSGGASDATLLMVLQHHLAVSRVSTSPPVPVAVEEAESEAVEAVEAVESEVRDVTETVGVEGTETEVDPALFAPIDVPEMPFDGDEWSIVLNGDGSAKALGGSLQLVGSTFRGSLVWIGESVATTHDVLHVQNMTLVAHQWTSILKSLLGECVRMHVNLFPKLNGVVGGRMYMEFVSYDARLGNDTLRLMHGGEGTLLALAKPLHVSSAAVKAVAGHFMVRVDPDSIVRLYSRSHVTAQNVSGRHVTVGSSGSETTVSVQDVKAVEGVYAFNVHGRIVFGKKVHSDAMVYAYGQSVEVLSTPGSQAVLTGHDVVVQGDRVRIVGGRLEGVRATLVEATQDPVLEALVTTEVYKKKKWFRSKRIPYQKHHFDAYLAASDMRVRSTHGTVNMIGVKVSGARITIIGKNGIVIDGVIAETVHSKRTVLSSTHVVQENWHGCVFDVEMVSTISKGLIVVRSVTMRAEGWYVQSPEAPLITYATLNTYVSKSGWYASRVTVSIPAMNMVETMSSAGSALPAQLAASTPELAALVASPVTLIIPQVSTGVGLQKKTIRVESHAWNDMCVDWMVVDSAGSTMRMENVRGVIGRMVHNMRTLELITPLWSVSTVLTRVGYSTTEALTVARSWGYRSWMPEGCLMLHVDARCAYAVDVVGSRLLLVDSGMLSSVTAFSLVGGVWRTSRGVGTYSSVVSECAYGALVWLQATSPVHVVRDAGSSVVGSLALDAEVVPMTLEHKAVSHGVNLLTGSGHTVRRLAYETLHADGSRTWETVSDYGLRGSVTGFLSMVAGVPIPTGRDMLLSCLSMGRDGVVRLSSQLSSMVSALMEGGSLSVGGSVGGSSVAAVGVVGSSVAAVGGQSVAAVGGQSVAVGGQVAAVGGQSVAAVGGGQAGGSSVAAVGGSSVAAVVGGQVVDVVETIMTALDREEALTQEILHADSDEKVG
jgi:hypothetical protein